MFVGAADGHGAEARGREPCSGRFLYINAGRRRVRALLVGFVLVAGCASPPEGNSVPFPENDLVIENASGSVHIVDLWAMPDGLNPAPAWNWTARLAPGENVTFPTPRADGKFEWHLRAGNRECMIPWALGRFDGAGGFRATIDNSTLELVVGTLAGARVTQCEPMGATGKRVPEPTSRCGGTDPWCRETTVVVELTNSGDDPEQVNLTISPPGDVASVHWQGLVDVPGKSRLAFGITNTFGDYVWRATWSEGSCVGIQDVGHGTYSWELELNAGVQKMAWHLDDAMLRMNCLAQE